ncbi:MAG: TetR/AcrR family transcriptional regulator [Faecousia sp.]
MSTPKAAYLRLREDLRREIEAKAIALYARLPYQEVTARVLCDALNINPATLYRWFDSKDDFYIYLMGVMSKRMGVSEDTVWDMDDFLDPDAECGSVFTEEEERFIASWTRIPENVMAELIFHSALSDDTLIRNNLTRMQACGQVRADINIDLTAYIYNSITYNIQRYMKERGITDPKEIEGIRRFVYYDLLRFGIKGRTDGKV